jgi:hypothetical protein
MDSSKSKFRMELFEDTVHTSLNNYKWKQISVNEQGVMMQKSFFQELRDFDY